MMRCLWWAFTVLAAIFADDPIKDVERELSVVQSVKVVLFSASFPGYRGTVKDMRCSRVASALHERTSV